MMHSACASSFLCSPNYRLSSSSLRLPFNRLHHYPLPLRSSATHQIVETDNTDTGFVEVGYISNVHGLQGEICVKSTTDFPLLRFSKPGRRWLKRQDLGRETIQQVELTEGRGHPGHKSWILRFGGIDSVEQAKCLIGSTLLVREEDRPELDEGEFYTHDLVGMRVLLKETGEFVGTVVNIFDSGASDLLQVMLNSSMRMQDGIEDPKSTVEAGISNDLVWVPFVEAIVPDVDINRREMHITPPKGLLELNLRSDDMSKKERRQLEWKEKKKFQKRLIAAKKRLHEMEQQHVFHGFRYGEKSQRSLLADQIVGVNSKLLQLALQNIQISSNSWNTTEAIRRTRTKLMKSTLEVSEECLASHASKEKLGENFTLREQGHHLISEGKVCIVVVVKNIEKKAWDCGHDVVDCKSNEDSPFSLLEELLNDYQRFMKINDRAGVPLILVGSDYEIQSLRMLFLNHDHFGFDAEKVWFLEEEKLPIVSNSLEEQNRHKILMKSPWEILQSPVGSGGVFSLLSSHNILEKLGEMGVEYMELCSTSQRHVGGNALLVGFVNSHGSDIGVQIFKDRKDYEESFDVILSIDFMKRLTRQVNKMHLYATLKSNAHVEKAEKEWIDVIPSSCNSYEFGCSIYSALNACPIDKVCLMEITK